MKKLKDMNTTEMIDYWHGYLCMAIGRGESREAIGLIVQSLLTLGHTNGFAAGKKAKRKERQ